VRSSDRSVPALANSAEQASFTAPPARTQRAKSLIVASRSALATSRRTASAQALLARAGASHTMRLAS